LAAKSCENVARRFNVFCPQICGPLLFPPDILMGLSAGTMGKVGVEWNILIDYGIYHLVI
jgi:hypothetical protein